MSEAFIGGAWRTITKGEAYVGGKWRTLTRAEMYIDGEGRQVISVIPPLSVSVSPSSVTGFANPTKPIQATAISNGTTATPSGGQAPYTYHWTVGSYTGSLPAIASPNTASTYFSKSVPADSEQDASFVVTVTDNLGKTATATVSASFFNQSQIG